MGSIQQYSLTWGEYGTSLLSVVRLLRNHGDLVDVTLSAGGQNFQAHKVVLSAASPLLLELLKSTPCKHPVLMLADVSASDLEALIEFMYHGEVSVDTNQLPSLLKAAQCLNIQGLCFAEGSKTDDNLNNSVKDVLNSVTSEDTSQSNTSEYDETCVQENTSTDASVKRRKRHKRRHFDIESQNGSEKLARQSDIENWQSTDMNTGIDNFIDNATGSNSQVNSNEETTKINVCDTMTVPVSPITPQVITTHIPKNRGASDQPGACPLCGAMLRQARNLRRHLVTSCKYRFNTLPPEDTKSTAKSVPIPNLSETIFSPDNVKYSCKKDQYSHLQHLQPVAVLHNLTSDSTNIIDLKPVPMDLIPNPNDETLSP